MAQVLIIDDEEMVCETLFSIFSGMGHEIFYSQTLKEGLAKIDSSNIDVVFLDVRLPDGNGLEVIDVIKQAFYAPEIIIFTGDENVDGVELAMQSGVWDYISKNESYTKFRFALNRALEYRKQKHKLPGIKINRDMIVGESPLMAKCIGEVATASITDLPILITGETGTGKELFSRAIHINSNRASAEFVVIDCTALPDHLVESALFGHVKGAFTGAFSNKTGLLTIAHKGTLFLDEVGELPLNIQKKFLRVLQEKKFRPVGGDYEVESDFRLICATHRDLRQMVKTKEFREDLFFRIFSMNIHLPALRDRKTDIQAIVKKHLAVKTKHSKDVYKLSGEFLNEIQSYEWPGNVRELLNTIDLICSGLVTGSTLFPHHLPGHIRAAIIKKRFDISNKQLTGLSGSSSVSKRNCTSLKYKDYMEKMKLGYLQDLLTITNRNIPECCKRSGLSRSQFYRLIQQISLKTR